MNNFFSQLNGFDAKYTEVNSTKYTEETEEVDYSAVDFCIGEEVESAATGSIFANEYNSENNIDDDYDDYTGFDFES